MSRLATASSRKPAGTRPEAGDLQTECVRSLESLAVALNPFFAENFEAPQKRLMQGLTDYRRGLPVTLMDGSVAQAREYDLLAAFLPRDTFKSTIVCELFPIWLALYWVIERQQKPAIYLFQATLGKAKLHLAQIKRMMCSDAFVALFPMFVPRHRDPEKWGTAEYLDFPCVDAAMGRREHSLQVASIGAVFTGHHGTDIIDDDAVTEENYASETEQANIFTGLQLQDNLRDTIHGLRYQLGTPYTSLDANVRCMKGDLGRPLLFSKPAFEGSPVAFYEWASPRTPDEVREAKRAQIAEAYPLEFPKRLTLDILAGKFRRQGSRIFSSQQLLDVRDDSKNIFRREWYAASLVSLAEAKKRTDGKRRVLIVDSAWKKAHNKGTGDDAAIGVFGYDADGAPYMLDLMVSDTMTEPEGMKVMVSMIARWGVRKVVKETFGEDNFGTRWRDFCKANGHRYVPVSSPRRESKGGKENRIRQVAPAFELGEFFLVDSLHDGDILRRQMLDYAGEGSGKDDILDIMADALHVEVKARPESAEGDAAWRSGYRPIPTVGEAVAPESPDGTGFTGWRIASQRGAARPGWTIPGREQ